MKRGRKKGTSKYDWSKVDWDMGDYAIAKILGCHGSLVTRKRKSLHIAPAYERSRIDWKSAQIDWTKSDVEIAIELCISSGAVCNRRRFLGLPPAFLKGEKRRTLSWAEIDNKLSERKTVHEWLNACGVAREERGKPLCLLRRLQIVCDAIHANKSICLAAAIKHPQRWDESPEAFTARISDGGFEANRAKLKTIIDEPPQQQAPSA